MQVPCHLPNANLSWKGKRGTPLIHLVMRRVTLQGFVCLLLAFAPLGSPKAEAADDPELEKYFIANAAYNRKLYPVAVAQFEGFLQKNASHPKADLARRGLALSLYALKLYPKAIPHFDV